MGTPWRPGCVCVGVGGTFLGVRALASSAFLPGPLVLPAKGRSKTTRWPLAQGKCCLAAGGLV